MIGYVTLGTNDAAKAIEFYDALLGRVNTIQRLHDKGEVDKKHKDNIQFVEA